MIQNKPSVVFILAAAAITLALPLPAGTEAVAVSQVSPPPPTFPSLYLHQPKPRPLQDKYALLSMIHGEDWLSVLKERQQAREIQERLNRPTGFQLILEEDEIKKLGVDGLNRQLDWHREHEKTYKARPGMKSEVVPLRSHMKTKAERVTQLKMAIRRYKLQNVRRNHTR